MGVRRITEVGIAVEDLDRAVELFESLFEADVGELIDVPLYDMRFRMCRVGQVDFEVMEPTGPTGVIADFLAKRGEGTRVVWETHYRMTGPLGPLLTPLSMPVFRVMFGGILRRAARRLAGAAR